MMTEKRLQMAVEKPNHAYILAGNASETLPLARKFAKALQCVGASKYQTEPQGPLSCGLCLSCKVFESGNHPDVLYVKATKTIAIGVDDVRTQIVMPMSEKTFRYRYKIFIIEQNLTPQAQNALLKTIEEPASYGIFLFLTENLELFLPTVLSRCVTLKLLTPRQSFATQSFATPLGKGVTPDETSATSPTSPNEEMQNFAKYIATSIQNMDLISVFDLCSQFEKWKESIQTLLDMLYSCLRDQLTDSNTSKLDAVAAAKKALYQNGNFQMNIETMLLKMSQS